VVFRGYFQAAASFNLKRMTSSSPAAAPLASAAILVALFLLGPSTGPGVARAVTLASPLGASADLDSFLNRLQHRYQTTKSFSANFDETITRPGAPPIRRSGVIYYQKPGRFRWEFDGSQPETIVSNGATIYDYDPALNQVVETPLAQAFHSQAAATFLLGAGNIKRDFTVQALTGRSASELVHLALTPKQGGQQLEAGIERQTYNIVALSLTDALGNRTDLSFNHIELNQPLPASQFSFTPPADADIVKSGGH
jgi:outer membrane lipoprotein carrier protein